MTSTQPSAGGFGQPPSPGAGLTDGQLESRLRTELTTVQQSPRTMSEDLTYERAGSNVDLGGGRGGGYTFSPGELDAIIAQWQSLLQHAQTYDDQIHVITMVTSAAIDEASTGFTTQAQTAGSRVQASHDSLKKYAAAYIDRLRAARDQYTRTEDAVRVSLRPADGSPLR